MTAQARAEAGLGSDAAVVGSVQGVTESGIGSDLAASPRVQVSASESGVGVEVGSLDAAAVPKNATDSGSGSEVASLGAVSSRSESGSGSEAATVVVRLQVSEGGILEEVSDLLASLLAEEVGSSLEMAQAMSEDYRATAQRRGDPGRADDVVERLGWNGTRGRGRCWPDGGGSLSDGGVLDGSSSDRSPVAVGVTDG